MSNSVELPKTCEKCFAKSYLSNGRDKDRDRERRAVKSEIAAELSANGTLAVPKANWNHLKPPKANQR